MQAALQIVGEDPTPGQEFVHEWDTRTTRRSRLGGCSSTSRARAPVPVEFMAGAFVQIPRVFQEIAKRYRNRITIRSLDTSVERGKAKLYGGTLRPTLDATAPCAIEALRRGCMKNLEGYRGRPNPRYLYGAAQETLSHAQAHAIPLNPSGLPPGLSTAWLSSQQFFGVR